MRDEQGRFVSDGKTASERIEARLLPLDHCLIWMGPTTKNGYGMYALPGSSMVAHRAYWIDQRGPLQRDLDLDHVKERGCITTLCCNLDHLEPVTHRENVRRSGRHNNKVEVEVVTKQIAELRSQGGLTFELIGKELGISRAYANKLDQRRRRSEGVV